MRIFKPTYIPESMKRPFRDYTNDWAVELETGETLYGFRERKDIEEALKPQPIKRFYKQ